MALPSGQDAPRRADPRGGRIAVLMLRIARARSRFLDIARADGVGVALIKAGRKARKTLRSYRWRLASRLGIRGCRDFTPPPGLDPYEAWLRVNQDNPRRRRRLDAAREPSGDVPRFSIVVPVYDPPIDVLRAMI